MQKRAQVTGTDRLFLSHALISFAALLLVFAAFDDITTDNATQFTVEYAALAACAIWFAFVAVRLIRLGYRTLGRLSVLALLGALWGQRAIHQGITPGLWPQYLVTTGAFLWFVLLVAILAWLGWRSAHRYST
jgi:hypothetical protein